MAGLRRIVAQRMFQSAQSVPRVTLTTEADVTEISRLRELLIALAQRRGHIPPSYTDIFIKVAAIALREHPMMNARLAEEEIQVLEAVNVGLAVAVPDGLVVPVIQGADFKSLEAIATESRSKIERARAGALVSDDITGGTFTVTSLGTYEIDAFTPIINLPEAGILGVGRIVQKPVVVKDEIMIRSMMHLSLTFDHRIIDGAPAAEFLRTIKRFLEKPYELLAVC
jgi:pyruvate dehydrogenase E2 component (dihydrolipoamide acetyltransferase)